MASTVISITGTLVKGIITVEECLRISNSNRGIASTLQAILCTLKGIVNHVDDTKENVQALLALESVVNEMTVVTSRPEWNGKKTTKFYRLRNLLWCRSTNTRLMTLMQRLQALLVTLQVSNDVYKKQREKSTESILVKLGASAQKYDAEFLHDLVAELKKVDSTEIIVAEEYKSLKAFQKESIQATFRKARTVFSSVNIDEAGDPTSTIKSNEGTLDDLTKTIIYLNECDEATIDFKDLDVKETIGKGGFGVVVKANWNGTGVAVKILHANDSNDISVDSFADFSDEIMKWRTLQHPNLVQLYGTTFDTETNTLCFVMELCEESLHDLIYREDRGILKVELIRSIGFDVASGIQYLHNKNIIHRDIKPKNVLLVPGSHPDIPRAKVCDFGMSTAKGADTSTTFLSDDTMACGTPAYMAPETLEVPAQLSKKSDTFSLGMLLYELVEKKMPFKGQNIFAISTAILMGRRPRFEEKKNNGYPAWLYDLIEACWQQNRANRPDIYEIKESLKLKVWPTTSTGEIAIQDAEAVDDLSINLEIPQATVVSTPEVQTLKSQNKSDFLKNNPAEDSAEYRQTTSADSSANSTTAAFDKNLESKNRELKHNSISAKAIKGGKKNWKKIVIGVVVGIIVVIIVIIAVILSNKKGGSKNNHDKKSCGYTQAFSGDYFCSFDDMDDGKWECAGNTCSWITQSAVFPLLHQDPHNEMVPTMNNCPSAVNLKESQDQNLSSFEILSQLSFEESECPYPTGSLEFRFDSGKNISFGSNIENSAFTVSKVLKREQSYYIKTSLYGASVVVNANGQVILQNSRRVLRRDLSDDKNIFRFIGDKAEAYIEAGFSGQYICNTATDGTVKLELGQKAENCKVKVIPKNSFENENELLPGFVDPRTRKPTIAPTSNTVPSKSPTDATPHPTTNPTNADITEAPTTKSTPKPTPSTKMPSPKPTPKPTPSTKMPSPKPTPKPTPSTETPTSKPTKSPTGSTDAPTQKPTSTPTKTSKSPTRNPTISTNRPTTNNPTMSTNRPTKSPTSTPTMSTNKPTKSPTRSPTINTNKPTSYPSSAPTTSPIASTPTPTTVKPTRSPSLSPTKSNPSTLSPTKSPTKLGTQRPTSEPTEQGTPVPTEQGTPVPTEQGTPVPSSQTILPTTFPTANPDQNSTVHDKNHKKSGKNKHKKR